MLELAQQLFNGLVIGSVYVLMALGLTVIFGILGAATRLNDHEAAREMFRIYNDWLADFCRHYPDRQIGLACRRKDARAQHHAVEQRRDRRRPAQGAEHHQDVRPGAAEAAGLFGHQGGTCAKFEQGGWIGAALQRAG